MALGNTKHAAKKSTKNDTKTEVVDVGQTKMGNSDSKGTIKFSSWTQTPTEVTIILHVGRAVSEREVAVEFTDSDVKVGLADGRKWSCCFYQAIERCSSRVQLRKMKIVLTAKKHVPNVEWPSYQVVESGSSLSSLAESDSSTTQTGCFDVKNSLLKSMFLTKSKSPISDVESKSQTISTPDKTSAKHPDAVTKPEVKVSAKHKSGGTIPERMNMMTGAGDIAMEELKSALDTGQVTASMPSVVPASGEKVTSDLEDVDSVTAGFSSAAGTVPPDAAGSSGSQSSQASVADDTSETLEIMECEETDSLLSSDVPVGEGQGDGKWCSRNNRNNEPMEVICPLLNIQQPQSPDSSDSISEREVTFQSTLQSEPSGICDTTDDVEMSEIPEADVRELDLVRNDYYETTDTVTVVVYVKEIIPETLKVRFAETEFDIMFQTSEPKFLKSYAGSTTETFFRWKVNLASTVAVEKCSFSRTLSNTKITLAKKVLHKWGRLMALPQVAGSFSAPTTQNTWMPTCQNINSPVAARKEPMDIHSDELRSSPAAKSYQASTSGYGRDSQLGDAKRDNKPTCKVSPLTSVGDSTVSSSSSKPLPLVLNRGMMGLDNIGNTCFMNSVLQLLANTTELRDYFLDGSYRTELNLQNPLGMEGKLANAFAYLMKILWTTNQSSFEPSKLKNLVAAKQARFVGYSQHDAEEFMEFLLDGLHEDLNRVCQKPYFEDKDITGDSDEEIANEAWRRHKMRNDSHIADVFQGQYRSRVVCPACEKVSITFDPFSIIQVPIPKEKKLINVIFVSDKPSTKPIKYHVQIGVDATVDHLKDDLYQRTRVFPADLRVLKISQCQIATEFTKGMSLMDVSSRDMIIACAVLSEKAVGEPVREFTVVQRTILPRTIPHRCSFCNKDNTNMQLKRCTRCYMVSYCNQECQRKDWTSHKLMCELRGEPVGCPFIISIPESKMTYSYLCTTIEAYARYSVNAFQLPPSARKSLSSKKSSSVSSLTSSLLSLSQSEQSDDVDTLDQSSNGDMSETVSEMSDVESAANETQPAVQENTSSPEAPVFSETGSNASQVNETGSNKSQVIETGSNKSQVIETGSNKSQVIETGSNASQVLETGSNASQVLETGSNTSQPPVRTVFATQQTTTPSPPPPFFLRQCTRNGTIINGTQRLADQGSELLNLENCRNLLVEWKNKEGCTPYVEVETKELDHDVCEGNFRGGRSMSVSYGNDITLGDCLMLFTEPEVLHPDQSWFCPACKTHRQATKEMSLWRLPPTLIIHLKRFSFSSLFWRNKIDDRVNFPINDLDMTPYLKRPLSPDDPPPIYDLYGVINHRGNLVGGHYTSYARCPDTVDFTKSDIGWRYFDDSYVTPVRSESEVISQYAYVLFYRRRDAGDAIRNCVKIDHSLDVSSTTPIITDAVPMVINSEHIDPMHVDDLDSVRVEDEDNEIDDNGERYERVLDSAATTFVEERDMDSMATTFVEERDVDAVD